jgi:uncharacterized protein
VAGQVTSFEVQMANALRPDRLQLILLPTEQCNFRCTYCYEDFAIGRMSPEVVAGVKNLIDRRAGGLRRLQVSWFGGEPMLARPIVEEIAAHAGAAARRHTGLVYEGDMTTNGYLLDAAAVERLAGLGVRAYQVSLDGPEHLHDTTRVRADGRGSFARIWRNLLSIRHSAVDVRMLLRVHLTPDNLPEMPGFVQRLRDDFLDDPRFSVFLKNVVRLGGPNDATMTVLGADQASDIAALEAIVRRDGAAVAAAGGRPGSERSSLFQPEDVCYAAQANSLLVGADGRLGKCTVALSDPINTIGRLRPDGTLEIDNPRLRSWLQGWESQDPDLVACPYEAFTRNRDDKPLLQITKRPA